MNTTETNDDEREKSDDYSDRTAKRAQWESFRFAVCPNVGKVNVCNTSYNDDENHVYTVTVEKRAGEVEATDCTCPANEHRPGPCKHRVAVQNAPLILYAATPRVATDGGHAPVSASESDEENEDTDGVPEPEIEGPITEWDAWGRMTGATYFRCALCGFEAMTRSDVEQFCDCRRDEVA